MYTTSSIIRLLFISIFLHSYMSHAQPNSTSDSLFLKNKIIPDKIKEATVYALNQYPELAETRIEFRFTKNISKSFMQAQPKFKGVFKNKKNRGYLIKITPSLQLLKEQIPVEELPMDVLIGWIGHELGHVLDYKQRSGLGMVGFGVGYIFSGKYKVSAEKRADMNAIQHGLGKHIHTTKNFIVNNARIPLAYKKRIQKFYMSPDQVMEIIDELAKNETEE